MRSRPTNKATSSPTCNSNRPGTTENHYDTVALGQARLTSSKVITYSSRPDGSDTTDTRTTDYVYNDLGRLVSASGDGADMEKSTTLTHDIDGTALTSTESDTNLYYEIINDQAELKRSDATTTTHNLLAGDNGFSIQHLTTNYDNDALTGMVTRASASGTVQSQEWGVINDQVDGTQMGEISSTDGFKTEQLVIVRGEAQLNARPRPGARARNATDGQTITTEDAPNVTVYTLDQFGRVIGGRALNRSTSNELDADGHVVSRTQTVSDETMVAVLGEAKTSTSVSNSKTILLQADGTPLGSQIGSPTGSTSTQQLKIIYPATIPNTGRALGASGNGTTWSEDLFGNISKGTITQTYIVVGNLKCGSVRRIPPRTPRTRISRSPTKKPPSTIFISQTDSPSPRTAAGSLFPITVPGMFPTVKSPRATPSLTDRRSCRPTAPSRSRAAETARSAAKTSRFFTVTTNWDFWFCRATANSSRTVRAPPTVRTPTATPRSGTISQTDAKVFWAKPARKNQRHCHFRRCAKRRRREDLHQDLLVTYVNSELTGQVQSATGNGELDHLTGS